MCSTLDRSKLLKKGLKNRGRSVSEQRNNRRQRLIDKFKVLRIKSVDSLRNLNDDDLTYEILYNLKKEILATLDQRDILQEDDINSFLKDLELELKLVELEEESAEYEKTCLEEIEALTNNLMDKCDICEDLTVDGGICQPCLQKHFASQFG